MKLLNLRNMILTLALCIAVPQYVSAEAHPSAFQNIWNKYKVAIVAAGAGVLALLGIGGGVAAYQYSQRPKELSQADLFTLQKRLNTEGINQVDVVGKSTNPQGFIDILTTGNIDATNKAGETALIKAVELGKEGLVLYLLSIGADPLAKDSFGRTPLLIVREALATDPNNPVYLRIQKVVNDAAYNKNVEATTARATQFAEASADIE